MSRTSVTVADFAKRVWHWLAAERDRLVLAAELQTLNGPELERSLHDCHLNLSDLRPVIARHPDAGDLLSRLMHAVGVDRSELARHNPAGLRGLEIVCTSCRSWRRCKRELARGTASGHYEQYCPNATALAEIGASGPRAI